ncbi:iron-sulfur cluster biosynthesis protein [Kibdelosporangium aridum]|uniref:Iron-sulfur cluster biosynthesis protein n=1 Tax=Kibdelosporangium aridum TaxID=2030 RepID=A0A428ZQR6_KIBAR|nr:iron-sulfur cluster biosynthesis family protein [Kibdelosporangium aridum]RSM90408.1 iron-sulfur cluster biosynthesis protein [Kibdelosporangium aridum]
MLAVTDAAAQAIEALTSQNGQQQAEGGLRFSLQSSDDAGAQLALAVTKQPEQGDQVVTADNGATVYLESGAAEFLDDKVLDIQRNTDGEVAFALAPQGV